MRTDRGQSTYILPFRWEVVLWACVALLCGMPTRAETVVRIQGLAADELARVEDALHPRLEFVRERAPSEWRADDAAYFLRRLLIRRGYPEAEVRWRLAEGGITLMVQAGPRYRVGTVRATAPTVLTADQVREYFLQPLITKEAVRADQAPYMQDYLVTGSVNVENYLRSIGYWNAVVDVVQARAQPASGTYAVDLSVQEGAQLQLLAPQYEGVTEEQRHFFTQAAMEYVGRPATTQALNALRTVVETYYADNGYQFAQVGMLAEHGEVATQLVFRVDSGRQYRVGQVWVEGTERTKPRRVRRYFNKERGENYDQAEIDQIVKRIISTGAYTSVVVKPITPDRAVPIVDLRVEVEEAPAKMLRFYAGMGNYEGYILGAGYSDRNFRGDLRRLYAGAEYSGRGLLGQVGIFQPRLFNSPVDANLRSYVVERYNDGYDILKTGLEAELHLRPERYYNARAYWTAEYATITSSALTPAELGEDDYLVTRLGIEQELDLRDSQIAPRHGFHTRLLLEAGAIAAGEENSFLRAEWENSYRYQLREQDQLMARFLISGVEFNDSRMAPIDVHLFAGGVNSHRGYESRELGPTSLTGSPLGGEAYWVASLQYARSVAPPLEALLFLDAGQVYDDLSAFSFSSPSLAVGLGIRLDLPIGPVRLEYGYNLTRPAGAPAGTLHFSIGTSF